MQARNKSLALPKVKAVVRVSQTNRRMVRGKTQPLSVISVPYMHTKTF